MSTETKNKEGRLVILGPGKTVLLPDIYDDDYSVENSTIEVDEEPAPEEEESLGFNPYDTARLYKK